MKNFTLSGQTDAPVSLKALLSGNNLDDIAVTITLAPGSTAHVYDDLIAESDGLMFPLIKHKLEFIVTENSTLHYYLTMVPESVSHGSQIKSGMTKPDTELNDTDIKAYKAPTTIEKELIFRLAGKQANAQAHGRCFANGSQIFKFKTLQDHQVEDTTSNLLIKGVLDDKSKLTCYSMIQIQKGAQRSNALQGNKNIVLSKLARAVSVPQLEIEANDVTCKHGAAVSNLNNEQSFYLQSRGLSAQETRRMLIDGFLAL